MLRRQVEKDLLDWKDNHSNQALLVTGARQVGKTYLVERFARENYESVVKFDLIDQRDVRDSLNAARSSQELFMAMSAYAGADMVPGKTVVHGVAPRFFRSRKQGGGSTSWPRSEGECFRYR